MRSDDYSDADVDDNDKLSIDQFKLPKNELLKKKKEIADSDSINVRLCRSASLVARKTKPRIKA